VDAAEILRNALALEPEARAALVDSLIGSLDQQQIDAAVEERLQQIDSGAVALVPWEDARRRLWSRLQA